MEDSKIVELYWKRSPDAIPATDRKYGAYCASIAQNILGSIEDAEECVNDTYMKAWESMPPHRPLILSAFLGKITRNLSFNKYKHDRAAKRGGNELPLVLDELSECVSGGDMDRELDRRELLKAVNSFLSAIPKRKRSIFVCRYWYSDSIADIAHSHGMKEGAVSMALKRTRADLYNYLQERGFEL